MKGPTKKAILDSFEAVREQLSPYALRRFEASGMLSEAFVEALIRDDAFDAVQARTVANFQASGTRWVRSLPGGAAGVGFNILDPGMVPALQALDSAVVKSLSDLIVPTVKEVVQQGIEQGHDIQRIGRALRSTVGLSVRDAKAVFRFRKELDGTSPGPILRRRLRDARFDPTIRKMGTKPLTAVQKNNMTAAYLRRLQAHNANVIAGTLVRDTARLAQHQATGPGG